MIWIAAFAIGWIALGLLGSHIAFWVGKSIFSWREDYIMGIVAAVLFGPVNLFAFLGVLMAR